MVRLSSAPTNGHVDAAGWPTVSVVFLVYNRRDELRTSLRMMLAESAYPRELVDVIVVDNASDDGSAEMVASEFPEVRLIRRERNCGVSGFNDGLVAARGDWVLALDDDCYLPPNGLRQAVTAARAAEADLVSFGVASLEDQAHRFDRNYRTGLLSFWGCAALMRREVVEALGGYDPKIFVWANELEFMLRFYDRGFAHLHLPEVVAVHMKEPPEHWSVYYGTRNYRINMGHWAYIAAKLLRPRDAAAALVALLLGTLRDSVRADRETLKAFPEVLRFFARGLRHREPLRNAEISAFYRRNFECYASPWWLSRTPAELARALPAELASAARGREPAPRPPGRREQYYEDRAALYPASAATLRF